jgi:hypothetical protein
MKPSHFTTPRQLADCAFIASADPIERPAATSNYDAPFMLAAAFVVVLALIVMGLMGWLQ